MRIEAPVPQDDDREWRELLRYGERRARELGIRPEDVERLIAEYRAEVRVVRGMRVVLVPPTVRANGQSGRDAGSDRRDTPPIDLSSCRAARAITA